eukprot:2490290-Amphidinium_carterae.3
MFHFDTGDSPTWNKLETPGILILSMDVVSAVGVQLPLWTTQQRLLWSQRAACLKLGANPISPPLADALSPKTMLICVHT